MLQFRLRTLFIFTTATAVIAWAFFAPPQWLGLMLIWLAYCLLPAVTISGIVFLNGYRRAFFIGMAPWIVIVSFWFVLYQFRWFNGLDFFDFTSRVDDHVMILTKAVLAVPLIIAIASGFTAVGIRWWAFSAERKAA